MSVNEAVEQVQEELEQVQPQDELTILRDRARTMGIKVRGNPSADTLRRLINDQLNGVVNDEEEEESQEDKNNRVLSTYEREQDVRDEALKLIRIRVTCMNPAKKDIQGEIFTLGNKVIGTVRKFVPFQPSLHPNGYHVPKIIYDAMQERRYQSFRTVKHGNGETTRESFMVKEFAIEVLPQLTPDELAALAADQSARGGV